MSKHLLLIAVSSILVVLSQVADSAGETQCPEYDINYDGFDIHRRDRPYENVNTWEQCAGKCRDDSRCNYWSWKQSGKSCWLKDVLARREKKPGMVSGSKLCTTPQCTGKYEFGVEYPRNDIRPCGGNKKPTAEACQEFCKSVHGCVGWEWGYDGDNCCAKSKMQNRKSGKSGRVAGLINACPPPGSSDTCYDAKDKGTFSYRGTQSTTKSGRKCQKWTEQKPHDHTRTPKKFPYGGLGDHNYCRHPLENGTVPSPWCYTTDKKKRWEQCGIPVCNGMEDEPICAIVAGWGCDHAKAKELCPIKCSDGDHELCHTVDCSLDYSKEFCPIKCG